ncbi:RNA polymerase sigma factor [Alteromonas aestuariivivens]|uniref:RNA polymerase sigma factor n=1 Tax=Alteromonas aestuariivivens TaxID=1938339 RepID=A0A3D8M8S9_9ALTE|nr:RNA polymerase sigma factor [Alteromonas aestuariivivens]RDV25611.1 RNA polymerase sigma factor [Alteromonas aestuariivivens]
MEKSQGTVVNAQDAFCHAREMAVIQAASQGDKYAYHQLYEQHVGRVYALCYRLTGERAMAEDATQEVFIQLWRKLSNYNGQSKFSTWLHSVTANVTVSYIRKQRGWLKRMFQVDESLAEQPAELSADTVDLESYIVRLPERARMVFVLHAIEGYRHEDIAVMLGMATGSSKAQFHRAKQLLKEWMGYEDN